ncbi:Crp/Fnr family transcriptional regulator [Maridesulfovibrio sp.]|uniref:Crp/Fnr family transcriptional regulator n=1 Tax=Maridesulfovibrio sp. TaxID=2795000 RepID=UPI0029F45A85|nr:Crp/Fnr family transcriptional regulator [Maridesulfovibrio sp.]
MIDSVLRSKAMSALRDAIEAYEIIQNDTWDLLQEKCSCIRLGKGEILYSAGITPSSFSYVYTGLLRAFTADEHGNEYTKIFFDKGSFPGSMRALLLSEPSEFTIETLEPSLIVTIPFNYYRELLRLKHDLALFQIAYLEKKWLIAKEVREVEIVMEEAADRYRKFLLDNPDLQGRVQQYHIASHLGITPTQLSRIRKKYPEINLCK